MRQRHPPPIPQLFRPPLFDPNRKCTSLRNKSRSKSHDTVNYVFARSPLHALRLPLQSCLVR